MLRTTCRDFAEAELKPIAGKIDKEHLYPRDQVTGSASKTLQINTHVLTLILSFASVLHGATERSLKRPYASLLLSSFQKTALRSHQNRV